MKIILSSLLLFAFVAKAQFKVIVNATVKPDLINNKLYLASNINSWSPNNEIYSFKETSKKLYTLSLQNCPSNISLKITNGSWDRVECDNKGLDIQNRDFVINSDTSIDLSIEGFKHLFLNNKPTNYRSKQVQVISDSFFIPQLKTKRRVWIYLPKTYDGIKKFPVLYMQDGQNLFDASTSAFGEWGMDEYLDSSYKSCIVVGIDHGGNNRLIEYNTYNSKFGKAKGKQYANFIVKTLKPYIDKNYKTLKDQQNTSIAGSSMGGLISYLIALQYPKIFGKVGVFSPSFWLNLTNIQSELLKLQTLQNVDFYFYSGGNESKTQVQELLGIYNLTKSKCKDCNIKLSIKAQGEHNEKSWQNELPEFFSWLL